MLTSLLSVAVAAVAVSAIAAPAPQITRAPALNLLHARNGAEQLDRRTLYQFDNFGFGGPQNQKESDCEESSYSSIYENYPNPPETFYDWMATAYTASEEVVTVTRSEDIEKFCPSSTGTPTLPASLTSAWESYESEYSAWQTSMHDKVMSIAEDCGPRIGPMMAWVVVTDRAECLSVASELFTLATEAAAKYTTSSPFDSLSGSASSSSSPASSTASSTQTSEPAASESASPSSSSSTGAGPRETGFVAAVAAMAGAAGVLAAL